ncbi:MAG: cytochrome c [Candidatus Cloacimonetes bacterium]|nr:cytochrome c [Candidatus Cloacimonadota bacterium]
MRGKLLFKTQYFNGKRTNSCKDCHNLQEHAFTKINKPGPPLKNSFFRKSFSKDRFTKISDAVALCMNKFQQETDPKNKEHLLAYLKLISDPKVDSKYKFIAKPKHLPKNLSGSSFEGRGAYIKSCLPCHTFHDLDLKKLPLAKETIYKKVRGMPPLFRRAKIGLTQNIYNDNFTKTKMPIFSEDRLSERLLIDIIAHMMKEIHPSDTGLSNSRRSQEIKRF